jgi:hypothetical protein
MSDSYTIEMTHESSLIIKDDQGKAAGTVPSDVYIHTRTDSWDVASMVAFALCWPDPDWVAHDKNVIHFGYHGE